MTITATEKPESRRFVSSRDGKGSMLDLIYNVIGTNDQSAARNKIATTVPQVWGSIFDPPLMFLQSITVEPIAQNAWVATVHYDSSAPEPLAANDSYEFDTTGGTQHITSSRGTVVYGPGAADMGNAIGVTDSGVDGVDIQVPALQFAETHYFPELSPSYKTLLMQLTGAVNDATFRGLSGGQVLFLGVTARKESSRSDSPWGVTYKFAVSLNRGAFSVGGIDVDGKAGWDYMWIRYAKVDDAVSQSLIHRPIAVYIERVYPLANFAALGIGP